MLYKDPQLTYMRCSHLKYSVLDNHSCYNYISSYNIMTTSTNTPVAKHENEESLEVPELPEETNEDTIGNKQADTLALIIYA